MNKHNNSILSSSNNFTNINLYPAPPNKYPPLRQNTTGFTIIEVALVLGLAGLIFAMVFLILPTLWSAERDSERRDNVLTFIDTLKNFQSNNNRGALPSISFDMGELKPVTITYSVAHSGDIKDNDTTWAGFYKNYFLNTEDPLDGNYTLKIYNCAQNDSTKNLDLDQPCENPSESTILGENFGDLHIILGARCDGATAVASANSRKVAVLHKLEGSNGVYCANS
ncbi:hypothetical protein IJG04_01215 [Candidatus Saccharibacteria bacterium]|nr:hypothetical protein [Candidatus Saccharibacteria bacterium]